MFNAIEKALKLIENATKVFGKALSKVEEANKILQDEIDKELLLVQTHKDEIDSLERQIKEIYSAIEDKAKHIENNKTLIEKFKTFIS